MKRLIAKMESEISDAQHALELDEIRKQPNEVIRLNELIRISKIYIGYAEIEMEGEALFSIEREEKPKYTEDSEYDFL